MSEKNFIICCSNFRYANYLMENIAERKELSVKTYVCTTWEKVKLLAQNKKIYFLMTDESYSEEERRSVEAEYRFVLTEDIGKEFGKGEKAIYQYQCADKIVAHILEVFLNRTNENILRNPRKEILKIVAVYSPIHRAAKTTFALALGKALSKRSKVLYLNMEEYSGFGKIFHQDSNGNLGDALYYIRQESSNFGIRLSMLVKQAEELDYIPPIPISSDLKEVTLEEWELLFRRISEESVYEIIILDLSESVQGLFRILQLCDKIYMPVLDDCVSEEKLRQFEENIEKMEMDEILEKTCQFSVPQNIGSYVKSLIEEEEDESVGRDV